VCFRFNQRRPGILTPLEPPLGVHQASRGQDLGTIRVAGIERHGLAPGINRGFDRRGGVFSPADLPAGHELVCLAQLYVGLVVLGIAPHRRLADLQKPPDGRTFTPDVQFEDGKNHVGVRKDQFQVNVVGSLGDGRLTPCRGLAGGFPRIQAIVKLVQGQVAMQDGQIVEGADQLRIQPVRFIQGGDGFLEGGPLIGPLQHGQKASLPMDQAQYVEDGGAVRIQLSSPLDGLQTLGDRRLVDFPLPQTVHIAALSEHGQLHPEGGVVRLKLQRVPDLLHGGVYLWNRILPALHGLFGREVEQSGPQIIGLRIAGSRSLQVGACRLGPGKERLGDAAPLGCHVKAGEPAGGLEAPDLGIAAGVVHQSGDDAPGFIQIPLGALQVTLPAPVLATVQIAPALQDPGRIVQRLVFP